MSTPRYLMENEDEIARLEIKTRRSVTENQAIWAGLKPGDRVADIGCGPGKTTDHLCRLVQPGGTAVGIDASPERIAHACKRYGSADIEFVCRDFLSPLDDLGVFDFVWVRFILEYYQREGLEVVRNLTRLLKPGGILCLIDIDHNCLCHHGLPPRLSRTISGIMGKLEKEGNFDPFAGRKLYGHLYDLNFFDIDVQLQAHHMIYGPMDEVNDFNWRRKVLVAAQQSGYDFQPEYPGGFDAFFEEFSTAFSDERRFIYTPLLCCRGRKRMTD